MIITKIIFEVFILYQVSQVISESKLTRPFREYLRQKGQSNRLIMFLYNLLSCFLCTSIWVGFLLSLLLFDFAAHIGYETVSWFWNGLFFSSITWFMNVWEQNKLNR